MIALENLGETVAESAGGAYRLHVDLRSCTLSDDAGFSRPFTIDPFRQRCLLEGLDDIGLTLRHADAIAAYEARRDPSLPRVTR